MLPRLTPIASTPLPAFDAERATELDAAERVLASVRLRRQDLAAEILSIESRIAATERALDRDHQLARQLRAERAEVERLERWLADDHPAD